MPVITEHTGAIDGQPVFWRSAPAPDPVAAPVLYLHGVPTSSDDWPAFLERTGGLAPDLLGFGRSGKRGDLDFTMEGYEGFIERYLELAGVGPVRLVVHDWGAVGLLWAMRFPERVERLVVMNAVPLLPGYRWHRIARMWRRRLVGETVIGATTRIGLKQISREANATPGPLPDAFLDATMAHFDQGTQRAILQLYRTSPEAKLAAAGAGLHAITCPALVVWGDADPYIPTRFADDYAAALGGPARTVHLPDAGHWPWLDRPDVIDTVAQFLTGAAADGPA